MQIHKLAQESITEQEAAQWLGISIEALHRLLDEHVFNNGTPRPSQILFAQSDLLLLSYWCEKPAAKSVRGAKVVSMPNRKH